MGKKNETPGLLECIFALSRNTDDGDLSDFMDGEEEESAGNPDEPSPTCSMKRVTGFFDCDPWEARILASIVMFGFEGDEFTARNLKKRLELPFRDLERLDRFLNGLLRKGWIRIDRPGENSMTRRYETNGKLVDAVIQEKKGALRRKKDRSFDAYLHSVTQLIRENAGMKSPLSVLEARIRRVHRRSRHLSFVKWVDGMGLSMVEVGYVCHVLARLLEGEDDIDANDVMNMTHAGAPVDRYRFRQSLLSGRLPMVAEGLIKVDLRFNGRLVELNATEKLVERMEGTEKKPQAGRTELKTLERVGPGEVVRKTLFFEGRLQKSLEEFGRLMEEDRLRQVLDRLESKGMNRGIVALFHGGAGTGKTESVMQVAAASGREVLRVNLSEIRNKYVGESEKAVKAIFAEYKSFAGSAERMPILLFNEADGVLGRRIRVSTSVDQMNNTMQNILLEELERFNGLLVATTNLATNMDPAFERRFTFKFAFENGGAELRERLWQTHFPELEASALRQLARSYELSPAQIANLAKRHEIQGLLTGEAGSDLEHFMALAEEETLKGGADTRTIGFKTR
jgi:hypothetical protein